MNYQKVSEQVSTIAIEAGDAILEIYNSDDFDVQLKSDDSPLTKADLAAHNIIVNALEDRFPEIPVLSEESQDITYEQRKQWSRFWLVDPLDGTKEFIKRNGEFTVNIALIDNHVPVFGVVYAPVISSLYWGYENSAFKKENGNCEAIQVCESLAAGEKLRIVASRSHRSEELENYLSKLPEHDCIAMGSSLKICLVADGTAHMYPRIGPTMEWDTAAADAVVRAAGGTVTTLEKDSLLYNKENLLNPYFIVNSKLEI
ncbi:MAG: 3'(2'),5'-bisphosphate nucleotidase CysQ [Lentisphaeria bacterium]|nr:3'(2'),5'-bisphosphate nucleotidase CysQ [Lentisphaeria bacterium]NQZ67883.1 3'(2'),5'-bisphosphate nucleotidase CysQ [Lentisphaeria bacterium]